MANWLNNDGLYIKFGADEGKLSPHPTGEYDEVGGGHVIEVTLDATLLNTSTNTILSDTVRLPKDYRIKKVEVYVQTAFAGATATLDIGLVGTDRSTVYDADGLVAAAAVGTLTNGATVAGAGALVGTTLATSGLLVAKAGTAVFTAGKAKVRIEFYRP